MKQGFYCICPAIREPSENQRSWKLAPLRTAARYLLLERKMKRTKDETKRNFYHHLSNVLRNHLSAKRNQALEAQPCEQIEFR